jgi:hypothetical protein
VAYIVLTVPIHVLQLFAPNIIVENDLLLHILIYMVLLYHAGDLFMYMLGGAIFRCELRKICTAAYCRTASSRENSRTPS